MRKAERILIALLVIGILVKLWAASAGVIAVIAALGLALFYFPFGFYFFTDKDKNYRQPWLSTLSGYTLSTALLGIIFELQFWEGSVLVALVATFLLVVTTVILVVNRKPKGEIPEDQHSYLTILLQRVVAIGLVLIVLVSIPDYHLLRFLYRHDPVEAELRYKVYQEPGNAVYRQQLEQHQMEQLQQDSLEE